MFWPRRAHYINVTQRLAHRLGHVLYLALGWIPELFTDTDSYLPGVGTK